MGDAACGHKLGRFVPRHEYLSFFVKRKVPKKTTKTYGLRTPWRDVGHAKLAVLISRNWYGGYRCRFGGLLVPPAPLPLTTARVGAGTLVVFGDYQIAPIAARSTAMGRWRLTPPWYWGDTACGRGMGSFVPPARVPFFFCKKKGTKENHLDLRSKGPLARGGQVRIWRCVLAGGVQRSSLSVKRTVPAFTGAEASATACPATVGVFASTGLAIIKSRLCRRKAAKVGVPVGHRI